MELICRSFSKMIEKQFLSEVRQQRKRLIDAADRKTINRFHVKPQQNNTIAISILLFILAVLLGGNIGLYLNQKTKIRTVERTILKEPIYLESIQNITLVNNTTTTITGNESMICIGSRNSTKMVCYK